MSTLLGLLLLKSQFVAQLFPFQATALFVCGEEVEEPTTMPHEDIGSDVNMAFTALTRPDFNQQVPFYLFIKEIDVTFGF